MRQMATRFEAMLGDVADIDDNLIKADGKKDFSPTKRSTSTREFIQQIGLKRHTDLAVAFGYYLEHQLGKLEFTPADINNCYYEAKLEPSNTSQSIIQNIKRSYMMEARTKSTSKKGARKRYMLTQSGEDFINRKLGLE